MSLITIYHRVVPSNTINGCPILVNAAAGVACTESVPGLVFTAAGADMAADPYDYLPEYPLLLKLFFTNVVMSGTIAYPSPEFIVNVSGPKVFTEHRKDEKNFGISIRIKNWDAISLNTTVSITVIPPLTGVSLNCLAGLSLDTLGSQSQF
jgi:hypothetical protein